MQSLLYKKSTSTLLVVNQTYTKMLLCLLYYFRDWSYRYQFGLWDIILLQRLLLCLDVYA